MKKSNQSLKKNKMTTQDVPKKYKNSTVSVVSKWIVDTLSSSLEENQIKELRKTLESKQEDLHKILSSKNSTKRVKDPDAPKRGKSSYIFFCVENREKVKNTNPDLSAKDIIKELGRIWRDTSDEKKEKYVKMSSNDKNRYTKEISTYVPSGDFKENNKTKKGHTSYMFFCKEQRLILKENKPFLTAKEITSELGNQWKNLSDDQKLPYMKLASHDKNKHNSEETPKEKPTKETPKEKPTKEKPTKEKPTKNITGFSLFLEEERESVKEEHPKWSNQQITKELSKYWNDLSQDEQDDYNERANENSK